MKVGVDISPLTAHRTGVGTYVSELMHGLSCADGDVDAIGYAIGRNSIVADALPTGAVCRQLNIPLSLIHKTWRYIEAPKVERIIGHRVDVVHATNFFLPPVKSAKRVLSVHDISFTTHPEWVNAKVVRPYADSMHRFCDESDAILVFSEFTKDEIVSEYGTGSEKIHVTPHGIRPDWCSFTKTEAQKVVEDFGIDFPYILHVGTIEERKNIRGLLDAFAQLDDIPHKLVLVGGMGWLPTSFHKLVDERALSDRVILPGYIPQGNVPAFYKAADAFVFPSHYEGFGFPLLEAFASDCPVIASNSSSLPEIGGDAVRYVSPESAVELSQAIRDVVSDFSLADNLRKQGKERVKQFSWANTVENTINVYRSVLS